jgi:hypothetical protein
LKKLQASDLVGITTELLGFQNSVGLSIEERAMHLVVAKKLAPDMFWSADLAEEQVCAGPKSKNQLLSAMYTSTIQSKRIKVTSFSNHGLHV